DEARGAQTYCIHSGYGHRSMTASQVVNRISFASRISQLARECPDERVYVHVAVDGSEPAFTWPELQRRSSQVAGALAERGLGLGDRLGIGLRNSPQFVLAAFAAWKLGAVP